MSRNRLIYVMDPMCSWCWGFAPVAEALIQQAEAAGVKTHVVVGGLRTGSGAALDPDTRAYIVKHWQAVYEATEQPFKFEGALPDGFVYDTEPACRAVVVARELAADLAWPLAKLIEHAFYAQGVDVTQAAELVRLAEVAGIPRIEFAEAYDREAALQSTQVDFSWARDLGISGFPTLLAERNGQLALLTNGYQPLTALAPLLGRWLERAAHA
ncbi:DsbA family protein [Pseudomonas sp. UBA4194]|uniref:DsbA family protein n=1 Tax=Pseudomonas sp. UBA4194 TaxID=1947317 RepID=UPI0025DE1C5A|nr:DsbA family protein [Pseudomonas sp. UBA4194]